MPEFDDMSPKQLQILREQMEQREYAGLSEAEIEKKKQEKEQQKQKNISDLNNILELCKQEDYPGISDAKVYLPEDIDQLPLNKTTSKGCHYHCKNQDALSLAYEKYHNSKEKVLMLNLASASRPGGAVREGANGQEEDLCRHSSLLYSLESEEASAYYSYNNDLHTHLGSDALIISPEVVVLKDKDGQSLDQPFTLSVMSCSAPMIRMGKEGKSDEEYKELLYKRIERILHCAQSLGYDHLILGAFGCGAFGNDAKDVSDAFHQAFEELEESPFKEVDFAILCKPGKEYNYEQFCRYFDEKEG